ncbi:MAG: DUF229 domain-containing protein [Planctomycetota bacterium]|nr:MAG: DUF229 domain-containing protein [Planctomycetota bacterium]
MKNKLAFWLFASLAVAACGKEKEPVTEPPHQQSQATDPAAFEGMNLIFISMDTTRADALSCYDGDRENTPNLDDFALDAALFQDCLTQSTGTAPSHRTMFTGQYVHRHSVYENTQTIVSPYTLATVLREQGWQCAAFTGGGPVKPKYGLTGFDPHWNSKGAGPWHKIRSTLGLVVPEALKWVRENKDERFFLFLHGFDPHCPYWPPDQHRVPYTNWYKGDLDSRRLCGMKDYGPLLEEGRIDQEDLRYVKDLYEAGVRAGDQYLGQFFEALKQEGLLEKSLIVFTSDHGESLGEHQWIGHVRMWEEQIRVPLLIRFPQGHFAGEYPQPVHHVDLMPTLLDYLKIAAPEGMQGLSLRPIFEHREDAFPTQRMRPCFFGAYQAVRFDSRWKISFRMDHFTEEIEEQALFDLETDPGEQNNLFHTEDGARRFQQILDRYQQWRQETAAEDARFRGRDSGAVLSEDDRNELNQLGYADDEEEE